MDRINGFLGRRPAKHRKVVRYRGASYEVTKDDLKAVRSYRSRRCLDRTFKLSRPLDLRASAAGVEALPARSKPDHSGLLLEKARRYHEARAPRTKVPVDKNAVRDVWEDDGADALRAYRQEWVYSIKEQYSGPVEECVFTRDDLESELRGIYLAQFRPREARARTIEELLPRLPEAGALRPFPEAEGQVWRAEGRKHVFGTLACSVSGSRVEVLDMECGRRTAADAGDEIRHVCGDGGRVYVSTLHGIYRVDGDGCCRPVHASGAPIRSFWVSGQSMAVLTSKVVNLYGLAEAAPGGAEEAPPATKTFVARHERPHSVRIFDGTVYVATANGLLVESAAQGDIKTLNYVVDFAVRGGDIYAINNLNRLIVVGADHNVKKNVVQHQMGRLVRVHPVLNLLAILFSDEIGIYKCVGGEYVPVNTLRGRYRAIEWHGRMPWLYAGSSSRVVLYT